MRNLVTLSALALALPATAQESAEPVTPTSVVASASDEEWLAISPEDVLVMQLAPDDRGNPRTVVIQLISAPFSQPWVENIRTLARALWWDETSVYRVQDNYVTQWGDATEAKPLPEGVVSPVAAYEVDVDTLGNATVSPNSSPSDFENLPKSMRDIFENPASTHDEHIKAVEALMAAAGIDGAPGFTTSEQLALLSIDSTQTRLTEQGWHDRDGYAPWVEFWNGWPIGNEETGVHWEDDEGNTVKDPGKRLPAQQFDEPYDVVESSLFWPLHCYGYIGVARDYAPDTGTGAELYTIIGQPQRHMDRNLAVVGRVIEGMEHLSSLPRGSGELGFYTQEESDLRTPIVSVRLASEMDAPPSYEYLDTGSETFARYVAVRANRDDAFYTQPAGGVDVCSVHVPVQRVID